METLGFAELILISVGIASLIYGYRGFYQRLRKAISLGATLTILFAIGISLFGKLIVAGFGFYEIFRISTEWWFKKKRM